MMHNYLFKRNSPLGKLYITSDGVNITGLWIENQKYFMEDVLSYEVNKDLRIFKLIDKWLNLYFDGLNPNFTIPVKFHTTAFKEAVWNFLLTIPYGKVVTYKQIADKLKKAGIKASSQAVGQAVSHNPISIIVPCHRVIGTNNKLVGYAGGLDKKKYLLELEKIYNILT